MVNTRSHDPYSAHAKPTTKRRAAPKKTKTLRQSTPPPPAQATATTEPGSVSGAQADELREALDALKAESGKE